MTLTLARRLFLAAAASASLTATLMGATSAVALQQAVFERIPSGVIVTPEEGAARRVRL